MGEWYEETKQLRGFHTPQLLSGFTAAELTLTDRRSLNLLLRAHLTSGARKSLTRKAQDGSGEACPFIQKESHILKGIHLPFPELHSSFVLIPLCSKTYELTGQSLDLATLSKVSLTM